MELASPVRRRDSPAGAAERLSPSPAGTQPEKADGEAHMAARLGPIARRLGSQAADAAPGFASWRRRTPVSLTSRDHAPANRGKPVSTPAIPPTHNLENELCPTTQRIFQ